uniref:Prolactin receptor n=1 Tax=Channa striata TaxID=64152 RepID=T2F8C0_CHASR|nr:prolactin receptor [Channa striata]
MTRDAAAVLLLLLFVPHTDGATRYSPPGKPALTSCRSPEKETFTCWWEPGSDGGLPTTYRLYYELEGRETVRQCPDYHTAGENSCFFSKTYTSIWVEYTVTVVASNALGNTSSDPLTFDDVMDIVKPNAPENVTALVVSIGDNPYLNVQWETPGNTDTRSGWVTLKYQLRIKQEKNKIWKNYYSSTQTHFTIYSIEPGVVYMVEVRCAIDHGAWSEWSSTTFVKVPNFPRTDNSFWILVTLSSFILFILWLLHMKRKTVKKCHENKHFVILPPVPGPKIKGFDKQLLKSGKSEEVFNSLVVPGFPPTTSNYDDLLVEYLEVYDPKEGELMMVDGHDDHDGCLKSKGSPSDSDSGRGSCDSMDKSGAPKEEQDNGSGEDQHNYSQHGKMSWKEEAMMVANDVMSPDMSGRVKTWPSVFSPQSYSTNVLNHHYQLEMRKQHCLSDSMFRPHSPSSVHYIKERLRSSYWEFTCNNNQPHPQTLSCRQLQRHSDRNISSVGLKRRGRGLLLPALRSHEYEEVQRVNEENKLLKPIGDREKCPGKDDYSKVKGVDSDNGLLLQREVVEEESNDYSWRACDYTSTVTVTQKPTTCIRTQLDVQDERVLRVSVYVDTRTVFSVHTYYDRNEMGDTAQKLI